MNGLDVDAVWQCKIFVAAFAKTENMARVAELPDRFFHDLANHVGRRIDKNQLLAGNRTFLFKNGETSSTKMKIQNAKKMHDQKSIKTRGWKS